MAIRSKESVSKQVRAEVDALKKREGLPFRDLLSVKQIREALDQAGVKYRDRVFSPMVTLWAFLTQVMTKDGACEQAVARVVADRASRKMRTCSANTGSYCTARRKLPLGVVAGLARSVGEELDQQAPEEWKFFNRRVVLVDGTTESMPDTPENQQKYPQSRNQKPGLGFPIMRVVMLFSLAVGTVLDCAIDACRGKGTGEQNLFRRMWNSLKTGDILLGDCLYDCYRDAALLAADGIDVVFGRKQSRVFDFRRGTRLGPDDHLIIWKRPDYDATRYHSREEWETLPKEIRMREIRIRVRRAGYKTRTINIVTSLLDPAVYSARDIGRLFALRWHCELDLRSIKVALGMGQMRCLSPDMVEKELWVHILGYNLIRTRMAQAASLHGLTPLEVSFTGAKNFMNQFQPHLARACGTELERLEREMLTAISQCRVGNRPGRKEPRAIKKRQQKYKFLTKPRDQARKRLPA